MVFHWKQDGIGFLGDPFVDPSHIDQWKEELYMVRVRKISNGFCYIANGGFFDNKIAGKWERAVLPTFVN